MYEYGYDEDDRPWSYRYVSEPQDQRVLRYDSRGDEEGCIVVAASDDDDDQWCDDAGVNPDLDRPSALATNASGDLFIADPGAHRVFMLSARTRDVTVVAGNGDAGRPVEGVPAVSSPLMTPAGLATDGYGGTLFIADSTARVVLEVDVAHRGRHFEAARVATVDREVMPVFPLGEGPASELRIIAGPGCAPGEGTRPAAGVVLNGRSASLASPTSLAYSYSRGLFVGDPGNHQVYRVASGEDSTGSSVLTPVSTGDDDLMAPTSMALARRDGVERLVAVDAATGSLVQADAGETQLRWSSAGTTVERPSAVAATWGTVVVGDRDGGEPLDVQLPQLQPSGSSSYPSGRPTLPGTVSEAAPCAPVTSQSSDDRDLTPQVVPAARPKAPSHLDVPDAGSHRFSGRDRVATSVDTSKELFPKDGTVPVVVIASASSYADAAGGARYAAEVGGSLLLTPGGALDPAVKAEVQRTLASGGSILVTGREAAITPAVFSALEQLAPGRTERVGGADRYETATKLAQELASTSVTTSTGPIYLVTGANYPDALVVVPLARRTGGLVVLSKEGELPAVTKALLLAMDPTGARTVPVGGAAAKAAASLGGDAGRTAAAAAVVGSDRYETARKVAERFVALDAAAGARTDVVGLATGTDWPDALVGSTAMGSMVGPLLLNHGGDLDPNVVKALAAIPSGTRPTTVVFGGEKVVPASALTAFATAAKG